MVPFLLVFLDCCVVPQNGMRQHKIMKIRRKIISRRRVSSKKEFVTCLKKVVLIVIEKKLSLWKSQTNIDEDKGKEIMDLGEEENAKTYGEVILKKYSCVP
jgi:hypothetical protein